MSVLQSSGEAWHKEHIGRFTAHNSGDLFTEPKSIPASIIEQYSYLVADIDQTKEITRGKNKGKKVANPEFNSALREELNKAGIVLFGDAAMSLIASKAGERVGKRLDRKTTPTKAMDRGSVLEHVAKFLLQLHWHPISTEVHFQSFHDFAGATPDFLKTNGEPGDIKAPESFGDLILFDRTVADNDHDALLDWSSDFYWQIMLQAYYSGANAANLVMFTDRLPIFEYEGDRFLEDGFTINPGSEYNMCMAIAENACKLLSQERPWPVPNPLIESESTGWWFVAKRFELTDDIAARIDRTVRAANRECEAIVRSLKPAPVGA